jgi:hypothetical protein
MIIYGAGMAGLLAANSFRRFSPVVREAQESLPNNHSALLRFRTSDVGSAAGVPFSKVSVSKAISYENKIHTEPNLFFSNNYSHKVTGAIGDRSINNLDSVNRYVAPTNLIELMASNCEIEYSKPFTENDLPILSLSSTPIISTIPMPIMMNIVGWEDFPDFKWKKIWTQRGVITSPQVNVCQTIYYPDENQTHYRASVVGNVVIVEHNKEPEQNAGPTLMNILRSDFGIKALQINDMDSSSQQYGKILPIDDRLRKEFISYLTQEYGIYSLGRFATWRQLILDDLINDIAVIERLMISPTSYDSALIGSIKICDA